jgi:hypothetical protein
MHVRYSITRVLLGLLFLALAPVQVVQAQFRNAQSSSGWTIDWNGGYVQPSAQWVPAYPATYGNAGYGIDNGSLVGKSTGKLPIGGKGAVIDVQAKVIPTARAVGDALGRAAAKLSVPLTLYALATELKFILSKNPDGSTTFAKESPASCTVAPCYEYRVYWNINYTSPWFPTVDGACTATRTWLNSVSSGYTYTLINGGANCQFYQNGYADKNPDINSRTRSPDAQPTYLPSTQQEFADAIALKSGWPTSSALPSAVTDALKGGESIGSAVPTLTGPASVTGPTSTSTSPSGTVTTSTVHNITYNNNNVTYNTVTTTNNNGVVTTTTVTPEDPLDQCAKYPDSVGCSKLDTPVSDTLKTKTHAVTVTAVAFSSSSVCPAPLSFTLRGASYGVSYQPLCDRLALLKTLFLALAGVLAAFIVADSFRVQ